MQHEGAVWAVGFSPDSELVISGSREGTLAALVDRNGQRCGETNDPRGIDPLRGY